MRIDRSTLSNIPDSLTLKENTGTTPAPGSVVEEKAKEVVQIQRPLPKTDSVEMKTNSNSLYNFENAPKLDPGQTNLANAGAVPATLLPGIPFREKVELPKTLPNGTSVDGGVGSGDLGLGKTRPGPNHMGIDLKAGGTEIRNQLNDALKLKEGGGSTSSAPPSGTVDYTTLGTPPRTEEKYEGGFDRPGMSLVSVDRNPFKTLLELPEIVEKVTGRAADFLDGLKAIVNPQEQEKKKLVEKEGDGIQEYVNPDAPEGTQPPVVTDETLEKVLLRKSVNTQPGVEEYLQDEIDGKVLSNTDPRRALISNPLPEDSSQTSLASPEAVQVRITAKGPDTVNPDPVLGGEGEPIVFDPNRPK